MSDFTPGPWHVKDRRHAPLPNIQILDEHGHEVAQASDVHMRDYLSPHAWTNEQANQTDAIGLANARLMAAAPELYESLKNIIESFSDDELLGSENWNMARAAIAKVEDGTPTP
jgi:hypothetical protein